MRQRKPDRTLSNKPLLSMNDLEYMRAWDGIHETLDQSALADARSDGVRFCLAVALLKLPDGQQRIAYANDEAGDGEGTAPVSHFVARARRHVHNREALTLEIVTVTLDGGLSWHATSAPARARAERVLEEIFESDHLRALLDRARAAKDDIAVSAAVLSLPDARSRVALADCMFGNDEARRSVGAFVRRVRRLGLLLDGETLERQRIKLEWSFDGWTTTAKADPIR